MDDKSILDTPFFQHMFFDQYMIAENGSSTELVFNIFAAYLEKLNSKNLYNKSFKYSDDDEDFYNAYQLYFFNFDSLNYKKSKKTGNIGYQSYLYNTIKSFPYRLVPQIFILFGGYSTLLGGHAVNIYVKKEEEPSKNYIVYIINSGEGINYHYNYKPSQKKQPVIIGFDGISKDIIKKLYIFCFFMMNSEFRNTYQQAKDRNISTTPTKEDNEAQRYLNANTEFDIFFQQNKSLPDINIKHFYNYIYNLISPGSDINNKPKPKYIYEDDIQFSSSCTYFSTYYYIKYFIFNCKDTTNAQNLIDFNNFILNIKKHIINYFIDNFDNLVINNKEKYNMNYFNIAHILIKDSSKILDQSQIDTLYDKIIKQYEISEIDNFQILNKILPSINFFDELIKQYNELKTTKTDILKNFYNLLEFIGTEYSKQNNINYKILIFYILFRSTRFITKYFINKKEIIEFNNRSIKYINSTCNKWLYSDEFKKNILNNNIINLNFISFLSIQIINSLFTVNHEYSRIPGKRNSKKIRRQHSRRHYGGNGGRCAESR